MKDFVKLTFLAPKEGEKNAIAIPISNVHEITYYTDTIVIQTSDRFYYDVPNTAENRQELEDKL